jgi:hopanoid biosynthesis associated radical SAM protein HpnH
MGIPVAQAIAVSSYIARQKLQGKKRYPLVLMLEPLWRCNLECAGCGKIQHPEEILSTYLTPEECWAAAEVCGAPVISIAGGEPLIHPQIDRIVAGLVERKKFVTLCTNAILLERWLPKFTPSKYFSFTIHLDGMRDLHDAMVDRKGVFDKAVKGIRAAKERGFRVTTNTTVFADSSTEEMRELFNFLTDDLKTDGIVMSPGYDYPKAPNQKVFLQRGQMIAKFRELLSLPDRKRWNFIDSPLFLEFLQGNVAMQCTAWGNPCRTPLGWQRPCYLMNEGYVPTFRELMEETEWDRYGYGRDSRCTNCMAHCGYEATAVEATVKNPVESARAGVAALLGRRAS